MKGNAKQRLTLDPLQRYTVEEAIAYLRSSRRTIYRDIGDGRLTIIKEGRRTYVPGSEIVRRSKRPDEKSPPAGRANMTESKTRAELYAAFQIARNALIENMARSGMPSEVIAKALSMGALQVRLISTSARITDDGPDTIP